MPHTLVQRHTLSVGATRVVRINCTSDLDSGESLTGTPTVAEVTSSDLTLGSKSVNTATYTDAATGVLVAIGKGIIFTAAGGTAGTTYRVRITCGTDATPAETLVYDALLDWE